MKKLLFTLAIGIAVLTSCESDLVSAPPSDSVGGASSIGDGVLLKKTIEDGVTFNYFYEGNKLIMIEDSEGGSETYTYTDGLLTKIIEVYLDLDDSSQIFTETYEYNSDNKLITESHNGILAYTFVHNANGTITETESPGGSINVYSYENGNRMTQVNTNGENDYLSTYDTNNHPLKNVHQREALELMAYYAYSNNSLTSEYTGNGTSYETSTTTYTYNSSGYPVTSSEVFTRYVSSTIQSTETFTTQFFYE
ncbi:MAG: hypothetical protein COA88_01355 [Kordia sp.]|nr:MAG: hypothetical protein COA88_01355 [Kordia sp.]